MKKLIGLLVGFCVAFTLVLSFGCKYVVYAQTNMNVTNVQVDLKGMFADGITVDQFKQAVEVTTTSNISPEPEGTVNVFVQDENSNDLLEGNVKFDKDKKYKICVGYGYDDNYYVTNVSAISYQCLNWDGEALDIRSGAGTPAYSNTVNIYADDAHRHSVYLNIFNGVPNATAPAPAPDPKPDPKPGPNPKPSPDNNQTNDYMMSAYLRNMLKEASKSDEDSAKKKDTAVDKDTYKSSVPSKTVTALDATNKLDMDLKVHPSSEKSITNQNFLANYFAGQLGVKAKIINTDDVFMRNDLLTARYGQKDKLCWNELNYKIPGAVYAVVYNQTDGAYLISGIIDANGNAVFEGFILRPASTITIFAAN